MQSAPFVRKASDTAPVACPCGEARRIVTGEDNDRLSVHRVTIAGEAKKHYHERLTECYVVLSGTGEVELGDERVVMEPDDVVFIPPGTQHAMRGHFEIINIVAPPFDPEDEFVVEGD